MAEAVGIGLGAARGIRKAHGLIPHRARTLEPSRDPELIAEPARGRPRRGSFRSSVAPREAISRSVEGANGNARPLVRTAEPDGIVAKVRRGRQAFRSVQWRRTPWMRKASAFGSWRRPIPVMIAPSAAIVACSSLALTTEAVRQGERELAREPALGREGDAAAERGLRGVPRERHGGHHGADA